MSAKTVARTPLSVLLRRYRGGITLALGLVILEHVAWIIEPAVFGSVIDALIDRAGDASIPFRVTLVPLAIWIGVFILNSGTGVVRRIVDPRIFLTMFTQLAGEISQIAKDRRFGVSKTAALAQLSEQYVTFFQYSIPEIIEQVIEIGGAVIALAAFDWRISVTCLTIVLPLIIINRVYTRKVVLLQQSMHDTFEDTYDVFSTQDPDAVRAYYQKSSGFKRSIASWGALNFGVMRFFLLIIFLVVLWIAIDMDEFTTGSIYSIVAYIWTFVTTSEYIPELMESWSSLKDISRRLKAATI
jgi:ABC-type multidrug transport system fused ATPase/permease subunit